GAARSLHAAVQYNGSVYVTGGVRAGSITNSVLGSYIKPDSSFPEFAPSTYFISTETTGSPGMPQPRAEHGAIAIPHPASGQIGAGAYVYVIGGSSTTTSTSSAQKTVFRSELGNSSTTDVSYPLEAWYISDPVPFALANANLKQIYWYTNQQKGGNIVIQFRTSKDNNCDTLGTKTQAQAPWQDTKPFSSDGLNSFPLTPIPANCFQYRVHMTPSNATTSNATPYLLRLGIIVEVPGATDLTVKEVTFNTPTSPAGMTVTIHNENKLLTGEPTLAANFTTEGSFFVDVFIYPPGVTAPDTQAVPTGPGPYAALSIDVLRSEVRAGPNGTGYDFTFTIPSTRRVCDYNTIYNTPTCKPRQLGEFFQQPGQYTVFVVVDGA
ncbi:MAG TPA: hypothetical protein VFT99_14115, partial [Roseiflexaceae bacterium]|nr:hypothetical protein [Roseiflexaceae bacterium]